MVVPDVKEVVVVALVYKEDVVDHNDDSSDVTLEVHVDLVLDNDVHEA